MTLTLDAVYADGVLKPLGRLNFPQPSRVRVTIEAAPVQTSPGEAALALARRSYDGLAEGDICVIEGCRLRPGELRFLPETSA